MTTIFSISDRNVYQRIYFFRATVKNRKQTEDEEATSGNRFSPYWSERWHRPLPPLRPGDD